MSVTSGFFNSINSDRRYDAVQMSSIFDGIITDGVLQNVGGALIVSEQTGMKVQIATGRAWFNHTWTLNDSILLLELPPAELILNRIDAVVVDVYSNVNVRANDIKIVSGRSSSNPSNPVLIKEEGHWQYPLAYIYVKAEATEIRQANITNAVGTTECPFVRAPLEKMTIDALVAQWGDQFQIIYEQQLEMMGVWDQEQKDFMNETFMEFNTWLDNLIYVLDGDVAGKLQAQIDCLKNQMAFQIGPFAGTEPPYTYTLVFPYFMPTDLLHLYVAPVKTSDPMDDPSEMYALMKSRRKELAKIDDFRCDLEGSVVFTCYGKKPETFVAYISGYSSPLTIPSLRYYQIQDSDGDNIEDSSGDVILGGVKRTPSSD